jgi:serine/threonine-protein kinase RsbW
MHVSGELRNLAVIRRFVSEEAARLGAERSAVENMIQAVDESAANIILHGYEGQPGPVEIEVDREGEALMVRLRDKAPHFDPTAHPTPDLSLPLEQRRPGGLGIHLSRQSTDTMMYRVTPDGANELTLRRKAFFSDS